MKTTTRSIPVSDTNSELIITFLCLPIFHGYCLGEGTRIKTAELNPGDLTTCLAHLQIDGSPGFPRESNGRCHPHFLEQR